MRRKGSKGSPFQMFFEIPKLYGVGNPRKEEGIHYVLTETAFMVNSKADGTN